MSAVVEQMEGTAGVVALDDPQRISVVVKALVRVTDAWSLSNAEAAALLDLPTATWSRMKAGLFRGKLDQDKMMRASLLIGIFKGLRLLFNGPLAADWPKQPNTGPAFTGKTPVSQMIDGGIPAMIMVRRHIDALRGGV